GVLAAAACRVDWKAAGFEEINGLCAGAGGVERGMLAQPDEFACLTCGDQCYALLHEGDGVEILHRRLAYGPVDIRFDRKLCCIRLSRRHPSVPGRLAANVLAAYIRLDEINGVNSGGGGLPHPAKSGWRRHLSRRHLHSCRLS